MGWEKRGRSSYYYRKERNGAHVRSVYVGRGEIARLEESLLEVKQKKRRVEVSRLADHRAALEALDMDLDAMSLLASTIVEAVMISAGFHQHKRQWRKRRE